MVAGADFQFMEDTPIAKAMYNAVPLHALPLSVNLLDNALLKHYANPRYVKVFIENNFKKKMYCQSNHIKCRTGRLRTVVMDQVPEIEFSGT